MSYPNLQSDEIADSREIHFHNREEMNFPQLMRFSLDFDLCVLQLQPKIFSRMTKRDLTLGPVFVLVNNNYRHNSSTYSPQCHSLHELEAYSCKHQVDILHALLFDDASANACG